ncbi:hypothetical protein Ahy_A09g042689 [Arachis hypogaea]|uniref:Uncharacterized protein n=1 Tax=Arachis hypogaea TaxID=3818 RepID=A0A445BGM3_ARAHY|nr:hypothetical protein Ahy_A09g042689 [Arachis hypogaea]
MLGAVVSQALSSLSSKFPSKSSSPPKSKSLSRHQACMSKKVRYTKKSKLETPCQQPPMGAPASLSFTDDDWLIPLSSDGGVPAVASFCSFVLPGTYANDVQTSEPCDEDLDPEANEVASFEQHIDNLFAASDAKRCKERKTTEFWNVDVINSDGIIKQAKLSVRKALEQPFNGRKIILRFNRKLQPIRDGADLLNGILGMLGAYYNKFFICEKN